MKKLSLLLKDWRQRKQLTQREAAAVLSVPPRTYEAWEQGTIPSEFVVNNLIARIGR